MRKALIITGITAAAILTALTAFFAFRPQPTPIEQKIIAYEETIGKARHDLKTKILSIQELKPYTGQDSVEYLQGFIKKYPLSASYTDIDLELDFWQKHTDSIIYRRFQATIRKKSAINGHEIEKSGLYWIENRENTVVKFE